MKLETKIKRHLAKVAPAEGCGFVLKDGTYVPLENRIADADFSSKLLKTHRVPEMSFLISIEDYLEHSGNIAYIVHSHNCDDNTWRDNGPSNADYLYQKSTAVPWWVFVLVDGKYKRDFKFGEVTDA